MARDSDTVTFVVSTSEIHSRKEERVKLRKEVRALREEEDTTTTFALSWHMTRGSRAKNWKKKKSRRRFLPVWMKFMDFSVYFARLDDDELSKVGTIVPSFLRRFLSAICNRFELFLKLAPKLLFFRVEMKL